MAAGSRSCPTSEVWTSRAPVWYSYVEACLDGSVEAERGCVAGQDGRPVAQDAGDDAQAAGRARLLGVQHLREGVGLASYHSQILQPPADAMIGVKSATGMLAKRSQALAF